jgi:hypothetical protein
VSTYNQKEREKERWDHALILSHTYNNNQMIWQPNKKQSLIVDLLAMFDL